MPFALQTVGLRKEFKQPRGQGKVVAVDNVSLEVRRGKTYGFLGPNGAGKTTTIRMILGLIIPDAGKIRIMDKEFTRKEFSPRIGYLPEEHFFYPHLKVSTFLSIMASVGRGNNRKVADDVSRVKSLMALDEVIDKKIGLLSKGQRQKVALAQAFLGSPELLILDEPSSGLDPLAAKRLTSNLDQFKKDGVTVFLSSHQLTEVELVCDTIGLIRDGKMVMEGNTSDLIAQRKARNLQELFFGVFEDAGRG